MKTPQKRREDGAGGGEPGAASEALIIFAALPRPGDVKKRLAREIGGQPAAALYNDLALHTFRIGQEALDRGWSVNLFYDPKVKAEEVRAWVLRDFHFAAERGSDPGERIQHAFDYTFHRRAGKAIIISSDIPGLEFSLLEEAAERLDTDDIVIGPASDGGCYLMGMKPPTKSIFRGLPWGTTRVFKETSERIQRLGLKQSNLPRLSDVDTADSYRSYLLKKMKSRRDNG
jgi:rSAM/selenodomain-associated transferase 1